MNFFKSRTQPGESQGGSDEESQRNEDRRVSGQFQPPGLADQPSKVRVGGMVHLLDTIQFLQDIPTAAS